MIDFFLGKKDKEVEKIARELGFEKIFFVKQVERENDFNKLTRKENQKEYDACLIKTKNVEIMRKFIDKASNYFEYILVLGTDDEINRASLEHKKTFALVAPEFGRGKDFLSQRDAGLNHVLCKIAKENDKTIVFRFSDVIENENKASIIGKLAQNIKLCKKYKTKYLFVNFCSDLKEMLHHKELESFERVLLMRNPKEHL
jgi:RNase P/RNase MRP subunit p30